MNIKRGYNGMSSRQLLRPDGLHISEGVRPETINGSTTPSCTRQKT